MFNNTDEMCDLKLLNLDNGKLPLKTPIYTEDGCSHKAIAFYKFLREEQDSETGGFIRYFKVNLNVGGYATFCIKEKTSYSSTSDIPCTVVVVNLMENTTKSYRNVGTALHESMFRVAASYSDGRVKCDVAWNSGYFHFLNGFRIINSSDSPFEMYDDMVRLLYKSLLKKERIREHFSGGYYYLPQHIIQQLAQKYEIDLTAPQTESEEKTEDIHLIEKMMEEVKKQSLVGKALVFLCQYYGKRPDRSNFKDWHEEIEYMRKNPSLYCEKTKYFFNCIKKILIQNIPLTDERLGQFMAGACIFILALQDKIYQKQERYGNMLLYPGYTIDELVTLYGDKKSLFNSLVTIGTKALSKEIPFDINSMKVFYTHISDYEDLLNLWEEGPAIYEKYSM